MVAPREGGPSAAANAGAQHAAAIKVTPASLPPLYLHFLLFVLLIRLFDAVVHGGLL